jgi:uncharacterized Zn finger protein
MRLKDSENFRKEYKEFREKISLVADDNLRNELESLLRELVARVEKIDNFHNQHIFSTNKNLKNESNNFKEELIEIRRKLRSRLGAFYQCT